MKQRLIFSCLFFSMLSTNAFSQRADSTRHMYFAFGIRANTFLLSDFNMSLMPPARLLVNFDPLQYVRLEFQYGVHKNTYEQLYISYNGGITKYQLQAKTTLAGGGLFGMYRADRTNFYAGFRYVAGSYTDENLSYSGANPNVETSRGSIKMSSGVLGGEYFLGRRFSIAGEFSITSFTDLYTPGDGQTPSTTYQDLNCETSVVFRFYPF